MTTKPLLVIFVDWFEPAFKAGGPVRSISNLSRLLEGQAVIRIFTSDTDHGDSSPLPGIQPDQWSDYSEGVKVWYTSKTGYQQMMAAFKALNPDAIYFNSLFSVGYFLQPFIRSLRIHPVSRKVIAPRGMLHQGALQFGKMKKKLFLTGLRVLGYSQKLIWQATDDQERQDILSHIGASSRVLDASNVPTILKEQNHSTVVKEPGTLRSLFVSRVQPKKNLTFYLNLLNEVEGTVSFDIVGPIEDQEYWGHCQEIISALPDAVTVRHLGPRPHADILALQSSYDLFVLPTFGENFGHSIFDALAGGLPVLVSDQTPWRGLEASEAGFDLPLEEDKWKATLQQCINEGEEVWKKHRIAARRFSESYLEKQDFRQQYQQLFFGA